MKQFKYVFKFCQVIYSVSKKVFLLNLFGIAITSIQPMISVILSARIIQQLIDKVEVKDVVYTVFMLIILNFIFGMAGTYIKSRISALNELIKDDVSLRVGKKMMQLPYERLEESYLMDLKQQALLPILEWGNFEFVMEELIPTVIGSLLTIAVTSIIVANNNLFLLIPIMIISVIGLFISNSRMNIFSKNMMVAGLVERRISYYTQLAMDFSSGKEVRLFNMDNIIMDKIRKYSNTELLEFTKILNSTARFNVIQTIMTQLQIFIIYGMVAFDVLNKGLAVGSFLEVTGLFANVGLAVSVLLNTLSTAHVRGRFLGKFFEFEELSITPNQDINKEPVTKAQSIKLKEVTFSYAKSQKEVLKNINLTIPAGQKLALVGENGSGKTTLVKIICGLIVPTEGEIFIEDNKCVRTPYKDISAVFQDFRLFSFSIKENIELSKSGIDDVDGILERVGLIDKINNLPRGNETSLYRNFDSEGISLSTGQEQKLAIARAMYKNTGIIVLDEPTAALDPKAEAEIFNNFMEIALGKTSILVSHRLSACRFCDNIIVLDEGEIIERGTHIQLMEIENGKYRKMFEAQAEFYN